MASRRTYGSYNDGCAAAHALDLIGDRWTLIVVRELLLGPKRFVDLERDVPGIGPSVLTQKLGALERAGVVRRETFGPPVRAGLYALTEWGYELEAVNAALSALTKAGLDVESLFAAAGFKGEADRVWSHLPLAKKLPKRIVFCGVGKAETLSEETFRRVGAFASRAIGDAAEVVMCTTVVNPGKEAFLSFKIPKTNAASSTPLELVIPGVEGQQIAIVVP